MSALFRKLNLKDTPSIVVLNAPESFEAELSQLEGIQVDRALKPKAAFSFALAFARTQAELDQISTLLIQAAQGDAILWIAYPKKSSRKYQCDFDRDHGWHILGDAGFEGVRQVAIDEDWSALRFRRVEFIRTLKRAPSRSLSQAGKKRAGRPD